MNRHFHSSISARMAHRQQQEPQLLEQYEDEEDQEDEEDGYDEMDTFDEEDMENTFKDLKVSQESTAAGHLAMRQNSLILRYLRLIETEVPELVGMRKRMFCSHS